MVIKTMNNPISDYCEHRWDTDAADRICLRCGQIREFPDGDSNPRVLWPDRDTKDDPLQLLNPDKALIAGVAKRYGIKKTAALSGISWKILRAWVGAYCRKPKSPKQPPCVATSQTPPAQEQLKGVTMPLAIPLAIILSKFDPGDCLICGGDLFRDDDYIPHYIQTPDGKLWLCGVCAEGVAKLFKALGITCQVIGDKDHA